MARWCIVVPDVVKMARRRRQRQGDVETNAMGNQRWCLYNEQQELQAKNHTPEAQKAAHRRTQELLTGGYGAINWGDLLDLYEQK